MNFLEWIGRRRRCAGSRVVTMEEVSRHNRPDDCWIIIGGVVYDVSEFLSVHPGGAGVLMEYAGRDCTEAFGRAHGYVNQDEVLFNEMVGFLDG